MRVSCREMEGRMFPRFYGKAYYEYVSDHIVLYPIPFNYIVGWVREVWFHLKRGNASVLEDAYWRGHGRGRQDMRSAEVRENQRVAAVIDLIKPNAGH